MTSLDSKKISAMIELISDRSDNETIAVLRDQLLEMSLADLQLLLIHSKDAADFVAMEIEQTIQKRILNQLEEHYTNNKSDLSLFDISILLQYFSGSHNTKAWLSEKLNELTENIKKSFSEDDTEARKVKKLVNYLGGEEQFHGNQIDYYSAQNSYIDKVIINKSGNPITLSIIYLLVAEKLQLPLKGISTPGHFLIAYFPQPSEPAAFYIDPFRKGLIMTKLDCLELAQQIGQNFKDEHLLPVSNRHVLIRSLNNLLLIYEKEDNLRKTDMIVRYINAIQGG